MKGGKGNGEEYRKPKKMSMKKFVKKSIDTFVFFSTAAIAAITVVATIVFIGVLL